MASVPPSLIMGQSFLLNEPGHDHVWSELLAKDPAAAAEAALAEWLGGHDFLLKMLGETYLFEASERKVTGPVTRPAPDKRAGLCLLNYLNGAKKTELSGRMVPETVLPGGDRFFSGGHALTRQPLIKAFGENGQAMLAAAEALGGQRVPSEIGAFSFTIFLMPRIFLQVTLCEKDDEFPAEVYYAFDSTASEHVSLGILAALVGLLSTCLTEKL
ncbi:hypothetical protein C4J81_01120 [Deltaproteobacteria bacterium Smac51]|nr:hypothetical protein C4J81_01120 [Deltaproteobacteria bacterium Smac51]